MAKVRFLEDHLYEAGRPVYEKGRTYTMSDDEADNLISLGVAESLKKPRSKAKDKPEAVEAPAEVEPEAQP